MQTGFIYLGIDIFASNSIQWGWLEMCLWPLKMTLQSTAFILSLLTEEIVTVIKSLQWDLWVFQSNFRTDILQLWSSQIKFHLPWLVSFAISSEMSYNHSTKLSPWLVRYRWGGKNVCCHSSKSNLYCGNVQRPYFEFGLQFWSTMLTAALHIDGYHLSVKQCRPNSFFIGFLMIKIELL